MAVPGLLCSQWQEEEGEVVKAGFPELVAESIPAELAKTLGPGVLENETWPTVIDNEVKRNR